MEPEAEALYLSGLRVPLALLWVAWLGSSRWSFWSSILRQCPSHRGPQVEIRAAGSGSGFGLAAQEGQAPVTAWLADLLWKPRQLAFSLLELC